MPPLALLPTRLLRLLVLPPLTLPCVYVFRVVATVRAARDDGASPGVSRVSTGALSVGISFAQCEGCHAGARPRREVRTCVVVIVVVVVFCFIFLFFVERGVCLGGERGFFTAGVSVRRSLLFFCFFFHFDNKQGLTFFLFFFLALLHVGPS